MRRWRGLRAGIYRDSGARHDDVARPSVGLEWWRELRARGAGRLIEAAQPPRCRCSGGGAMRAVAQIGRPFHAPLDTCAASEVQASKVSWWHSDEWQLVARPYSLLLRQCHGLVNSSIAFSDSVRRAIGFGDWNLECSRKPINRIPPMLTCR